MKADDPGGPGFPGVKICGLTRRQDAESAVRAGAGLLGVVLVPGTPRALSPASALGVAGGLGLPLVAVLADRTLEEAVEVGAEVGAGVLQLHGGESPEYARKLGERGTWKLWKALRVRGRQDVLEGIAAFGGVVDGILLDGWHPRHQGGSGTRFSWGELEEIRGRFPVGMQLIVAGGLTPGNVEEAVRRLSPHVVDVSSGVESSPGIKDPEQIRAFVHNAHRAGKGEGS